MHSCMPEPVKSRQNPVQSRINASIRHQPTENHSGRFDYLTNNPETRPQNAEQLPRSKVALSFFFNIYRVVEVRGIFQGSVQDIE